MSTLHTPKTAVLPPLVPGERLDRATFHERYEAMPPNTRAELIGGVVCMPSPLSSEHGDQDVVVAYWLGHYQRFTPGVTATANATTFLDDRAEPQPDLSLRIQPECGGQTRTEGEYLAGAPELIVEIARSSKENDLDPKLKDYERAGAREYLVVGLDPNEIHWFTERDHRFQRLQPGADGWFRSEVFPGLWLDPEPLFVRDLAGLCRALEKGLALPEHAAFVARLAEERQRRG
jgi:Uma2 family endonuclease